ncbi:MAG: DUF2127 domain-containing protein [Methanomassiliicoccus sp.]|nr:DUF2127 domain-containing protein [Methanomassiliicoccus sp.]
MAILNALGGIMTLIGGVAAIGVTSTGILAPLGIVFGGFTILIGLFQLIIAWGLWTGKKWAWLLALIFGILGVIFGILGLIGGGFTGIVSLLINAIIVYYLMRPEVKAFFGR